MIEIEDEVGCDTDGREEGVGAAVVAGSDAPPVLEFTEHVFDLVAGLVEFLVEGGLDLSVSLRWYAGLDVPGRQRFAELVAVMALVGDECFCWWQARIEKYRAGMVAHLTFGQQHGEWLAVAVADNM